MPTIESERIGPQGVRLWLTAGAPLCVSDALQILHDDSAVALAVGAAILECGFHAVFWECRPFSSGSLQDRFEFVVIDAPVLARMKRNPAPFADQLPGQTGIRTFPNLGGDARLVVPPDDGNDYTHLVSFLTSAPASLQAQLWREVAASVIDAIDEKPVWLSTSGLGVGWLHVRIDHDPRYYTFRPYKLPP
ncbi:MAG: hypothetical protein HKN49_08885 [Gammaproteobacteria bacterium]|nr:hypothetical protein [Gammaproteobacteria bacterium]